MKKIICHCGIDVDDKNFNVAVRNSITKEIITFKCRPSISFLKKKLEAKSLLDYDLLFCYEASYIAFSLYHEIIAAGFKCDVIAPSLIPRKPGERVKTDKTDAIKLAEYYSKGDLTVINIPDKDDEIVRDVLRSRKKLSDQLKVIRRHILAVCRRSNLNYRLFTGCNNSEHWTKRHLSWLKNKIKELKNKNLKFNITSLLTTSILLEDQISNYDEHILNLSKEKKFKNKVQALRCFKGLETLSSMTLICELGDINRFNHPSKLTSYVGMDISEYSSGGKEKKFGITKQGNKYIRTTVIESCQFVFYPAIISKKLKERRKDADEKYIDIADRCLKRLKKKSTKMIYKGKPKNKIKVACAREMLCFIWEVLKVA